MGCMLSGKGKWSVTAPSGYEWDLWYVVVFQFWLLFFEWWECVITSIIALYPGAVCHWFWVFVQYPFYACFMMGLRTSQGKTRALPGLLKTMAVSHVLYVGLLGAGGSTDASSHCSHPLKSRERETCSTPSKVRW